MLHPKIQHRPAWFRDSAMLASAIQLVATHFNVWPPHWMGFPKKSLKNHWKSLEATSFGQKMLCFFNKILGSKNSLIRGAKAFMVEKNDGHQTSQELYIHGVFLSLCSYFRGALIHFLLPFHIDLNFKQAIKFSAENPASKLLGLLDIPGSCSTAP